ncbi:DUF4124 domain-containing protein [Shewanella sp. WXL01]|uniref:DUF4124 domain-containing protein n=1 Tax=Shewanella sp. WXL01 TaxID=2709721 RepID=UPI0014386A1E|nr:DUF4124 domain-containing protein [Shewanella sp. WXL01]NKF49953.1 DUF4124 domain-containing protein [Shewanella sp. WXL01]
MDSQLRRYILVISLMVTLALIIDHYNGKWVRVSLGWLYTQIEQQAEMLDLQQPESITTDYAYEKHLSFKPAGCGSLAVSQANALQKTDRGIYSWVDENGQQHFSDAANASAASELTQYKDAQYNFSIFIDSKATNPPAFLRDKMRATLKDIDKRYRQLLPKKQLQPIKINIMLAGNKHEYNKLSGDGFTANNSQGFYSPGRNLAAVWHRNDLQAFTTAIHESVHVMNAGQFGSTPMWFNEGLAEYFQSGSFLTTVHNSDYYQLVSDKQLRRDNLEFKRAAWLPLKAVLYSDGRDWQGSLRSKLYDNSHRLMRMLMTTSKGRSYLRSLFKYFSENRCTAKNVDQLIKFYPNGFSGLERDWQSWQRKFR